jgi:hypothetical protein
MPPHWLAVVRMCLCPSILETSHRLAPSAIATLAAVERWLWKVNSVGRPACLSSRLKPSQAFVLRCGAPRDVAVARGFLKPANGPREELAPGVLLTLRGMLVCERAVVAKGLAHELHADRGLRKAAGGTHRNLDLAEGLEHGRVILATQEVSPSSLLDPGVQQCRREPRGLAIGGDTGCRLLLLARSGNQVSAAFVRRLSN